ncbi:neuronal PAS domain-containing protein 1-like [Dendronephthya gigantea]|uniref:neuronal PAS domain-containing protein 1-like n=1 Tax=Dendronephthya gigantea TaxID=151771 RepID=UPI00106B6DC9|nr:neuronal PAS domain-containing protein 1-like [Dendronephthya gigantea]
MVNAKKEDAVKDKKTPNTIRNEQQKLKSRVAAKNRRKNESENIEQLTRLVPCIPENPPDKSTTIRLSTSYIALMKVLNGSRSRNMIGNGCSETKGIENLSLEIMDGFIIILSRDGIITFVNEKVVNYLGFPPHELMGRKIYNFVLRKDWELVAKKLRGPLPSMDNPNIKEPQVDPDDVICEPDASEMFGPMFENVTWLEKVQFSVRMQCNLIRKASSTKSTNFQIVRFTGRLNNDGFFLGTGEHAWSPDLGDLPVYEPAFISRLSPDLKLLFCEGRIHRYMDAEAKDIVGRVVYPFYHPTDIFHIQKMHSKLLAEGKVTTVPYRWMNKDGGWVWLKSTTTRIQDDKTGRTYMVCVNYVLSAIENKGVMVGVNPETQEKVIEKPIEKENENDSDDAYLVDSLTEAFTKSNPFGQPKHLTGEIEDARVQNVFSSNFPRQEPRYSPSFTSQEQRAKPLQEFYSQQTHQEEPVRQFDHFSAPQRDASWRAEDQLAQLLQHNDLPQGLQTNKMEQILLEDLLNGQFPALNGPVSGRFPTQGESVYSPGNIYELDQDDPRLLQSNGAEEPFAHQSNEFVPPQDQIKLESGFPEETDLYGMLDLPQFHTEEECHQEDIAYKASLYLFTNDMPTIDDKFPETLMSQPGNQPGTLPNDHQRHNGFTHGMHVDQSEQLFLNFPKVNGNNNILSSGFIDPAGLNNSDPLNGFAEQASIFDFDPTLLNQ